VHVTQSTASEELQISLHGHAFHELIPSNGSEDSRSPTSGVCDRFGNESGSSSDDLSKSDMSTAHEAIDTRLGFSPQKRGPRTRPASVNLAKPHFKAGSPASEKLVCDLTEVCQLCLQDLGNEPILMCECKMS
jgi:hypothetical protein